MSDKKGVLNGDVTSLQFFTINGKQTSFRKRRCRLRKVTVSALGLYVDYQLVQLGVPSDVAQDGSNLARKVSSSDIYPLFAIYEYFDPEEGFWKRNAVSLADLKSERFAAQITPGARVTIFTREFLSDLLSSGSSSGSGSGSGSGSDATQQLIGLQATGLT